MNSTISKNHLLHNIDKCTSINELYKIVQKNGITVRMQTLNGASAIPQRKASAPAKNEAATAYLDRLKRCVMQAVEEQYKN